VELRAAFRTQGSARAVATLKAAVVRRTRCSCIVERRGALWVVTRIGGA